MRAWILLAALSLSLVDVTPAVAAQGVVPGLTGSAAVRSAGDAAVRFRELTEARIARADLHTAWGTFFNDTASTGLRATHTVLNVTTTGGDYVYAPTALPPGNACLEMTTAYTPSGPKLWAWDWCGGRDTIGKVVDMDAAFQATYTTVVDGRRVYTMDEHRTSTTANTWTAYLMNYRTGAWDVFYTSTGTKDIPGSTWDFFEIYTTVNPSTGAGYFCRDLQGATIDASNMLVQQNGNWVPASPTNSSLASPPSGSRFDCPSLTFSVVHANDAWRAQVGQAQTGTSYEAEATANTLAGQAVRRNSSGASGGAVVGYVGNGTANYLQLNNITATAGTHRVTIYYASGENRSVAVSADNGTATTVSTPSTGGWDTVGSVTATLTLAAGTNTIRLANPSGWAPDIDRVVVS
ncbi:carbohydrate-binding protein [Actinophytocola oryzae]|uniref:Carbohydrate binding protein with CBM6 domain n=1 Tax=Actinophytocola oryzae TaxID=502181 RepID=A0A4R7V0W8_9PSEU|nr:carbohydrate-binding protein [Actinophytocola oryzae]TDV42204.1 carbohydrate binding protein with CBM6 domain [Actinophytocola oryzae]